MDSSVQSNKHHYQMEMYKTMSKHNSCVHYWYLNAYNQVMVNKTCYYHNYYNLISVLKYLILKPTLLQPV